MRWKAVLAVGGGVLLALIAVAMVQLSRAPRNLVLEQELDALTASIDEGSGSGALRITLQPVIVLPDEQASPRDAFRLSLTMNLVGGRFIDGPSLDPAHLAEIRRLLGAEMDVRLSLAGAVTPENEWSALGQDLYHEWSVEIDEPGRHSGSIQRRFEDGSVVAMSADQFPFNVTVGSAWETWWDSTIGRLTAFLGLVTSLFTLFFAWGKHRREAQAARESRNSALKG